LSHINLSVAPKERIAILGPNGAGKSSLIKFLAGQLTPSHGTYVTSAGLKIGYFAQQQVDHLRLDESPIEHLRDLAANTAETDLRKFLGSFGFSGDRVFEPVNIFSGGEKSRLALALIVWQQPNLLLLDEPTNHLDLEMRNALSLALQEYEGAMILVSHDRFLVRTTTDKLLLVAEGKLQDFDGDLNDYQKWLFAYRKQQTAPAVITTQTDISKKEQRQLSAKQREARRPLMQKIESMEKDLVKLQKKAANIEAQLTDQSLYEPHHKQQLQEHLLALSTVKKELEKAETAWLLACEERDQ
jgi:ATP-binding cassette subfamily F protein 3